MRRSRHTDDEIAFLLQEAETGVPIAAICASAYVSLRTFYRWRRRLGGLPPAGVARLGRIEAENARLKAEVVRLRQALLSAPLPGACGPERAAIDPQHPAALRFRGQGASVGRFAFVRSAN
ncbi:transposase [Methylobacterium sp. NEAU K]|uniref:transposase n=1 Tax=Methylobacterium sp. NEAU K TaxID=3064946 RepID=UPI00273516E9|nr:transposase [Methylobacterium sp. NEAU K]MDP4006735.1 transposase [Methylobacterium sp. NEAU K]